jgi:hypothetical protein
VTAELQVVVVDDDIWKRDAMALRLDATKEITVVEAIDQDSAASWVRTRWEDIDAVLVDVFDDRAPGEAGTDLYSGITVIERVARLPVRSVAVTPTCAHPLVQLRLHQAQPDFVYHRWQVADLAELTAALRFPDRSHRLAEPSRAELGTMGASRLLANDAVRAYTRSPLYGLVQARSSLKQLERLGISRRMLDRFKAQIVDCGFVGAVAPESATRDQENQPVGAAADARWPDIRDLTLKLIGRMDAPLTEFDRPWW